MQGQQAEKYRGVYIWFDENWLEKVTDEFLAWWEPTYGDIEDYVEKDEYLIRMAFAFMGWQAFQDKAVAAIEKDRDRFVQGKSDPENPYLPPYTTWNLLNDLLKRVQ